MSLRKNNFIKIKSIFKKICVSIFPSLCLICGKDLKWVDDSNVVCKECLGRLKPILGIRCSKCGRSLISEEHLCLLCRNKSFFFDRHFSLFEYLGEIRELIYYYKFKQRQSLAEIFAKLLFNFIESQEKFDYLVPVPANPASLRKRGFDQVLLLAQKLSLLLNLPILKALAHRAGKAQKGLGLAERLENISQLFYLSKKSSRIKNKKLLLLDDIFTTGTTLDFCSRLLKEAGAKEIVALTIAQD